MNKCLKKQLQSIGALLFYILLNTFTPWFGYVTIPLGLVAIIKMIKAYKEDENKENE